MSEPVAASAPPADPSQPTAEPARYGGFWVRLGASVVDSLIIWLAWGALILVMYLVGGKSSGAVDVLQSMVLGIAGIFYQGYFLSSERMATPGKRLFGLYVTDTQNRRLSFPHAIGRSLASIVSAIVLCLGYVMIAFYPRKQALHDIIASTLVHRRPGVSTGGMIFFSGFVFVVVFGAGLWYAVGKSLVFDYVARLEMAELYKVMSANKVPVQDYAKQNHAWPTAWEQVESAGGKNPMKNLDSTAQLIVKEVRLEEFGAMVAVIDLGDRSGKFRLAPHRIGNNLGWNCYASADIVKYAPEACGVEK